ncbi:MAG: sugar transferase [Proteobacteria bacterium]|nr:sugar transferase [Patescibacteria group bacterium]MBU1903767.1 sugar transferase [Pseudomonadota bacterium]
MNSPSGVRKAEFNGTGQGPVEFPLWSPIQLARDELPIPVKVEYDAYYLENRSFSFDLKILWMTLVKVVKREGVTH